MSHFAPSIPAPSGNLLAEDGQQVSLATLYADRPLLLQFSRHLGCVFCVDHAKQLLKHYETFQRHNLNVALVIMGDADQARKFREVLKLKFPVYADVDQSVYKAFEVPRGNVWQVAGPHLWWEGLKALTRSGIGPPKGDLMQLSGTYLIDTNGQIVWDFRPSSSAEFPNVDKILVAADTLSPIADA
ncbi:SelL-related redox protein [Bremerella sp. T1]|uniref:peroxiredoxin-like family protein n=1 Tax=Bremerella sp. TYQ1 TaxID=3119568 RepID=UPI001CCDCEC0|nr:peroxiredoxin-like family protein [Bremerella volcania]UBM34809.1 AhpC/TSA family protein [Bremerella volcania]